MYPEDRVLVAVINRKRDFDKAQTEHWYRVPQGQAPKGIFAEYIAFFFSRAFKELNGGVHYYARRTGIELARRRDLLPEEASHPRASQVYYKLQFGELRRKEPPIVNQERRAVSFIYTTWDRFVEAETIADLYSEADRFVDRVFHALERSGIRASRTWEAARTSSDGGAQLIIECARGTVMASTGSPAGEVLPLKIDSDPQAVEASIEALVAAVNAQGGPLADQKRSKG